MDTVPAADDSAVIERALPELKRRGLAPEEYRARVAYNGDTTVVVFIDKRVPEDTRMLGNPSKDRPGFEVELNSEDLSVIRAYFIR